MSVFIVNVCCMSVYGIVALKRINQFQYDFLSFLTLFIAMFHYYRSRGFCDFYGQDRGFLTNLS